jgi:ribonucleoside-diphosphate reductase beta chain
MRLWAKASTYRWDPTNIDFEADRRSWETIPSDARERLRQVCTLFLAGEKAVATHLLPMMHLLASEERLEEVLFLTSFLADEAKHVDFFCRFFEEVAGDPAELSGLQCESYQRILDQELKTASMRLYYDTSPEAQVNAAVTCNLVVEGVMAESGLYLLRRMLNCVSTLPAMSHGVQMVQRDESRHIAFGVYFLSRLVVQYRNRAYKCFLHRMGALKPMVEQSTQQLMRLVGGTKVFDIGITELTRFSQQQFHNRAQKIIRARTQTLLALQQDEIP